jgi:hypothetical protein
MKLTIAFLLLTLSGIALSAPPQPRHHKGDKIAVGDWCPADKRITYGLDAMSVILYPLMMQPMADY